MTEDYAAFEAGWLAAMEFMMHEWGPSPPKTPEAAFGQWKLTCPQGHIVRIKECASCQDYQQRGIKGIEDGKYDE
jgi:hypothetical protein